MTSLHYIQNEPRHPMPHSLSESQLYTYKSTWDNETHAFPPASTHLVSGAPSVTVERPPSSNRLAYVDALVDANALVIESIWKTVQNNNMITRSASVVPLRTFIQEVLKRSKTTYSTLQTALFYLFRSRPEIVSHLQRIQSCNHGWEDAYISCGRRMFLASLVVASKFVQDKTYRNSAWAKIAGLPVAEINVAERIFLNIIDYRLYISQPTFEQWHHLLHRHVEAKTRNLPTNLNDLSCLSFAAITNFSTLNITTGTTQTNNLSACNTPLSNQSSPHTPRNGWTLVLSPSTFLPPQLKEDTYRFRKRRMTMMMNNNYANQNDDLSRLDQNILSPPLSCSSMTKQSPSLQKYHLRHQTTLIIPPVLSASVPSSSNSSPLQTPTQISPLRMNNGTAVFNWKMMSSPTPFEHNKYPPCRSFINYQYSPNDPLETVKSKKRKVDDNMHGYQISHVRQSKRATKKR